jgi:uncharacterized phage-associated protein
MRGCPSESAGLSFTHLAPTPLAHLRATMLIQNDRAKLINTVVYFAANTRYCGKVKLFKLLYLLDFAHFRETGRSVTGLEYRAWKMGPVPLSLMQEWDQLEPDMGAAVDIVPEQVIDYIRERVSAKTAFDPSLFTKRELRMMDQLAARFRDEMTRPLIDFTHAERGPWDKIWDDGRGNNERIPLTLAVSDDDPNREAILESARDYEAIAAANSRHH